MAGSARPFGSLHRSARWSRGFVLAIALAVGAAIVVTSIGGCVTETKAPRRPLFARSEPGSIVVRNETGEALFDLTIQSTRRGDHGGRVGRISSVPPGSDQFVTRPAHAPQFPDAFDVSWRDARGNEHAERVSLKGIKSADHPTDSTLYIRILPAGEVVTIVHDAPPLTLP